MKQRLVARPPLRPGKGEKFWVCSDPLKVPSDPPWLSGSDVGTEQCQVEPWPRDRRSAGIVAPAQLEQIVSVLANDGHDTDAIPALLGHRSIMSTVRYTALTPNRFKNFWKD